MQENTDPDESETHSAFHRVKFTQGVSLDNSHHRDLKDNNQYNRFNECVNNMTDWVRTKSCSIHT